ncbi:MAG: hypothetical protein ACTSWX_07565 [Promethearchaeota archaeon]
MVDEILKELWEIKDNIAKEHGNDLDALTTWLKKRSITENRKVINLKTIKRIAEQGAALDGDSAAIHPRQ